MMPGFSDKSHESDKHHKQRLGFTGFERAKRLQPAGQRLAQMLLVRQAFLAAHHKNQEGIPQYHMPNGVLSRKYSIQVICLRGVFVFVRKKKSPKKMHNKSRVKTKFKQILVLKLRDRDSQVS